MRETMAAMFLRQCGYRGTEPVLDPMCGSGTFVIEAAEIAAGLQPGRDRPFAFEQLAGFDADAWQSMRQGPPARTQEFGFFGSDADKGAIEMSRANAVRAGLSDMTSFSVADVGELKRPDGPPGLVICNPPYGIRLDDKRALGAVYARLGRTLRERFSGWRVGIVTSRAGASASSPRTRTSPTPPA